MIQPPLMSRLRKTNRRFWRRCGFLLTGLLLAILLVSGTSPAAQVSNYELNQAQPFNQVANFPVQPIPSSPNYRPNGRWIGRLILPSEQEYADNPGDWAWFEVWHSPADASDLLGQTVKLTWQPSDELEAYLEAVTKDVTFNQQAENFLENGNIVPVRINGRKQVGPLQSLAGARPQDDVTVRLVETEATIEDGQPVLKTRLEPIQITGREYGLVTILEPDTTFDAPLPEVCPGEAPCPTEYFRVQHFDSATGDFTGAVETIRIPQQPMLKGERFFSNLRELENSPAGREGWYIYGTEDAEGVFTVQALKPRALFRLQPTQVVLGQKDGLRYIDKLNWRETPQRKGNLQSVLVSPNDDSADAAIAQWQEGDYALLIHLFGGIGGENKEFTPAGTVTGHFAYGLARVRAEPIAQELQFDVQYQQIYAHNTGGIVSGTHDWSSYTGDMARGWLGIRPVSDIVVKLDSFVEPFEFGDTSISLFRQLLIQTQILAARYRTGDGTGVAGITPATSCVQDSNQALFIAMEQVKRQVYEHPQIIEWIQQNPDAPELERINRFAALGQALTDMLTPYGVVRPDWKNNAESLAGITPRGAFASNKGLFSGALSWQTMMPRWGQDEVARIFLLNGAQLWFLRTNMVGGNDPRVEPIPPTTLFGLIPGLGRAVQRFADAFAAWPTWWMVFWAGVALALYGGLAFAYGRNSGFFEIKNGFGNPVGFVLHAVRLFFVPALVEEIIFRVVLLPHPKEGVPGWQWLLWAALSLVLFILWHWLLAQTIHRSARQVLTDSRFLFLVGGLGIVLTGVYWATGSLWLVVFMHWITVLVWIYALGGKDQLPDRFFRRKQKKTTGKGGAASAAG
jgi:predicted Abi (CAAX) family protease